MLNNADMPEVTVIGAGIIGVNIAVKLQKEGYSTTIIDKNQPAEGCSSGNAGIIAAYGVTPVSMPGLWKQVPKMLLDPVGPLSIRLQHVPNIAPWLYKFWRAGNRDVVEKTAAALATLVRSSLTDYQSITREAGLGHMIKPSPILAVYESKEQYEREHYVWELRKRNGVEWRFIHEDELRILEPSLSSRFKFAIAMQDSGFVIDPQQFTYALYKTYMNNGGKFIRAKVNGVTKSEDHLRIETSGNYLCSKKVVIACGAMSGELSRSLGEPVPLQQERGYHVTLSGFSGQQPRHPIMSPSHKVIATPMECGLRIAGMVEFGGFLPPNNKRSAVLHKQLNELFPEIEGGTPSSWMGHRPTLPDSLPVIGRSKSVKSVYYAFGHQHIGLTCAPMTARLISELISGKQLSVDIDAFRPDRF